MTSMAGAWMSLACGFGGMRTDGRRLSFSPTIPARWKAYSFRILYRNALIEVRVDRRRAAFERLEGPAVQIDVFDRQTKLTDGAVTFTLK